MKATVQALIDAGPKLTHVGVLLLFTFLCFGILGAQLFAGSLRERCHVYVDGFGLLLTDATTACGGTYQCAGLETTVFALTEALNRSRTPAYTKSKSTRIGEQCTSLNVSAALPGDAFCCVPAMPPADSAAFYNSALSPASRTTNPYYGLESFDDVVHAWLVVFRAICIEDWAVTMQLLMSGNDAAWGVFYMCLLVLVPGWLATNLTLAVIYEQVHLHNMLQVRLAKAEAAKAAAEEEIGGGGEQELFKSLEDGLEGGLGGGGVLSVRVLDAKPVRVMSISPFRGLRLTLGRKASRHFTGGAADGRLDTYRRGVRGLDYGSSSSDGGGLASRFWGRLQRGCEATATWPWFNHVFTMLIVLNTIAQCAVYAGMPLALCRALDIVSLVFTIIFALEMAVKLIGLGCSGYCRDKTNLFDGFIVTVSLIELVVTPASGGSLIAVSECSSGINPSVFRTLRLVRLLNTIPSKPLRELLSIISGAVWKTLAICLIFFLLLYTCSLIGLAYFQGALDRCQECEPLPRPLDLPLRTGAIPMLTTSLGSPSNGGVVGGVGGVQLPVAGLGIGFEPMPMPFGARAASLCRCDPSARVCLGGLDDDDDGLSPAWLNGGMQTTAGGRAAGCFARTPAASFDSFGDAFLSTFMIFTGEEFHSVMFLSMRNVHVWTFAFFTLALVLGRYVLLNMYTAVILSCLAAVRRQAARPEAKPMATPVLEKTAFGSLMLQLKELPAEIGAGAVTAVGAVGAPASRCRPSNAAAMAPGALAPGAITDTEDVCSHSTPSTANGGGRSRPAALLNGGGMPFVAAGADRGGEHPSESCTPPSEGSSSHAPFLAATETRVACLSTPPPVQTSAPPPRMARGSVTEAGATRVEVPLALLEEARSTPEASGPLRRHRDLSVNLSAASLSSELGGGGGGGAACGGGGVACGGAAGAPAPADSPLVGRESVIATSKVKKHVIGYVRAKVKLSKIGSKGTNRRRSSPQRSLSLVDWARRSVLGMPPPTNSAQSSPEGSFKAGGGGSGGSGSGAARGAPPMTEDRAALMLQARFRQHKAWVNVRAIRLVREETQRLSARGPRLYDPLGLERVTLQPAGGGGDGGGWVDDAIGAPAMMPAANASRRWQPPKFSACKGAEADASMLSAFEEEAREETEKGRSKLDFEYQLPVLVSKEKEAAGGADADDGDPFNMAPPPVASLPLPHEAEDAATGREKGKARRASGYAARRRKRSRAELRLLELSRRFRPCMRRLSEHAVFNGLVMVLILLSTIVLCVDSPRLAADRSISADQMRSVIATFNFVFSVLFTVEMGIKLIALGCKGYFCNYFNMLDAFCVFVGWATIVPGGEQLGALKSLRTLRGLRPLRLITRIPSMAIVIEALIRALPAIGNVALVLLVFWLVFAILGVQVFGGSLSTCMLFVPGPLSGGKQLLIPMTALQNQSVCEAMALDLDAVYERALLPGALPSLGAPGSASSSLSTSFAPGSLCAWPAAPRPPVGNQTRCRLLWHQETSGFNNVGESLLTLTEVALLQGWSGIMHKAMAARGAGLAPLEPPSDGTYTVVGAAFFVIFVLVGGFMLIKLFAGVVIDKFNRLRDERSGSAFMSDEEKEWVETRKLVQATRPLCQENVPSQPLRKFLYGIAAHKVTEYLVMLMILLNVGFMAITSTYRPPGEEPPAWHVAVELVFTWFFLGEAAIKLVALFPRGYFRVAWNCFDFFLCSVSVFDMAFAGQLSGASFNPMLLRLLRMFRIARLIRLVRSAKGLRTLLLTISRCMPALGIICSLICLNAIIFATIGMSLFGHVIPQPHLGYGGEWPAFDFFPSAFLLMIVMATSEQWPTLMRAVAVQPPFCGAAAGMEPDGSDADCGVSWVTAAVFFVLYQFLGALLMMNLMVGVVVDEFSNTSIQQNMRVPQTAISEFQEMWIKLDPDGTGFISCHYLPGLISRLLPPLGVKGTTGYAQLPKVTILRKLEAAWLPLRYGQVQFQETLFALARIEVGQKLPECALKTKLDRHARRVLDLRHLRDAPVLWNAHEYFAAEMLQRTYRGFRAREALHAHKQQEIKKERVSQAFRISSTLLTHFVATDASNCSSRLAGAPRASAAYY